MKSLSAVIQSANATETPVKDGCVGLVPEPPRLNPLLALPAETPAVALPAK